MAEVIEEKLINNIVPVARKFTSLTWVKIIGDSMQNILPFIFTGSLIFIYNVLRSYISALPDLQFIANFSFGMLGLILSISITNNAIEYFELKEYFLIAPVTSTVTYILYANPEITDGILQMEFGRFGPTGMVAGIIIAVITTLIFRTYRKLSLYEFLSESSLPDFMSRWINAIIPIFFSILIAYIFNMYVPIDLFILVQTIFQPVQNFGQSLLGLIFLTLTPSLLMSMGISSWAFNAVSNPVFLTGMAENMDLVAQGLQPVNIVTQETVFTASLITMGGIGGTLALNIHLLRSKSKRLNAVGKATIFPSLFGISEPILFGTPMVMNPILMIPMWLCTFTGAIIVWMLMSTGLLNIPTTLLFTGQLPVGLSTVIATQDWRGIIWFVVLLVIYLLIYLPFFNIIEKQELRKEQGINEKKLEDDIDE